MEGGVPHSDKQNNHIVFNEVAIITSDSARLSFEVVVVYLTCNTRPVPDQVCIVTCSVTCRVPSIQELLR